MAMRQDRAKVEAGAAVARVALAEADWTDADTAAAAAVANAAAASASASAAMGSPARSLSRDSLVDHSPVNGLNGTTTPPPGADAFAFAIDQADSAAKLNGMLLSHLSSKSPPDSPERSLVRSWGPGVEHDHFSDSADPHKNKSL